MCHCHIATWQCNTLLDPCLRCVLIRGWFMIARVIYGLAYSLWNDILFRCVGWRPWLCTLVSIWWELCRCTVPVGCFFCCWQGFHKYMAHGFICLGEDSFVKIFKSCYSHPCPIVCCSSFECCNECCKRHGGLLENQVGFMWCLKQFRVCLVQLHRRCAWMGQLDHAYWWWRANRVGVY